MSVAVAMATELPLVISCSRFWNGMSSQPQCIFPRLSDVSDVHVEYISLSDLVTVCSIVLASYLLL